MAKLESRKLSCRSTKCRILLPSRWSMKNSWYSLVVFSGTKFVTQSRAATIHSNLNFTPPFPRWPVTLHFLPRPPVARMPRFCRLQLWHWRTALQTTKQVIPKASCHAAWEACRPDGLVLCVTTWTALYALQIASPVTTYALHHMYHTKLLSYGAIMFHISIEIRNIVIDSMVQITLWLFFNFTCVTLQFFISSRLLIQPNIPFHSNFWIFCRLF